MITISDYKKMITRFRLFWFDLSKNEGSYSSEQKSLAKTAFIAGYKKGFDIGYMEGRK